MKLNMTNPRAINATRALSAPKDVGKQGLKDPTKSANLTFAETLQRVQQSEKVKFSKHAEQRFSAWGCGAEVDYVQKLDGAMDIAQSKGAKSTLVLMKGVAFVVAPQTRTVVTVIPEDRIKQNVFTSIDSAVLLDR